jgi:hypothetical protein
MSYKHSNMLFRLKGITAAVSLFLFKLQMGEVSKTKTVLQSPETIAGRLRQQTFNILSILWAKQLSRYSD